MKELRVEARAGHVDIDLLEDLRDAWGSERHSADVRFLSAIAGRMLASRGPFLECGSGLTTLLAGGIAKERGTRIWVLEQDAHWYRFVRGMLDAFDIGSVVLCHAPLRLYGEFAWFNIDDRMLPPRVRHVFCDGPDVAEGEWIEPVYSNWVAGLVPVLRDRGVQFDEILLRDAADSRAVRTCRLWNDLDVETQVVSTPTRPFIRARPAVRHAEPNGSQPLRIRSTASA